MTLLTTSPPPHGAWGPFPGERTTFQIRLPAKLNEQRQRASGSEVSAQQTAGPVRLTFLRQNVDLVYNKYSHLRIAR